jgi:hypothetical protein
MEPEESFSTAFRPITARQDYVIAFLLQSHARRQKWSAAVQRTLSIIELCFGSHLREAIHVTRTIGWLRGRLWWNFPRYINEIEKLGHVHLRCITCRQIRKIETRLNEFQNGGVVGGRVRYIVSLDEG